MKRYVQYGRNKNGQFYPAAGGWSSVLVLDGRLSLRNQIQVAIYNNGINRPVYEDFQIIAARSFNSDGKVLFDSTAEAWENY